MANINRPNGFKPVRHLNGSPYNGQVNRYVVLAASSTAVFVGDLVKLTANNSQANTNENSPLYSGTYREVVPCAVGDPAVGVVVGFAALPPNLDIGNTFRPSGAQTLDRIVLVADSPDLIFEVGTTGTVAAATDGSLNANISTGTAGSTTTGKSGQLLDLATKATTATLQCKIIGYVDRPDNDITATNARAWVMINNHQLNSGTGTAGV